MRGTRKAKAAKTPAGSSGTRALPEAYYRVHALWVATRALTQHEDELCTLMHEMKRSGVLTDEVRGELATLLEEIPAADLVREVDGLRGSLEPSTKRAGARAKRR